jgi:hypothetical protein
LVGIIAQGRELCQFVQEFLYLLLLSDKLESIDMLDLAYSQFPWPLMDSKAGQELKACRMPFVIEEPKI